MNSFADQLNEDLINNHLNPDEFGENCIQKGEKKGIIYRPSNGAPERVVSALYDTPYASAGTEAEEDVNANRPHLTVRQCDLEDGQVFSDDRFITKNKLFSPVMYDGSNGQGVVRFYLHVEEEYA